MATRTRKTAAVRKTRVRQVKPVEKIIEPVTEYAAPVQEKVVKPMNCKKVLLMSAGGVLAVLAVFWYKTNTWPIAAVANGRVITRFAVDKNLYQQGGKTVLDNLITEQLVKAELDREKITVSSQEIKNRIDELTKQLPSGSNLKDILASRGMTQKDLENQIELQMRVEKAISTKAVITEEELDKYVKENDAYLTGSSSAEKRASAAEQLKSQKSQAEISKWVDQIRKSASVWTPDNSWKATTATTTQ